MQNDTNGAISKIWDCLTCPPPGVGYGIMHKTDLMLKMETTWIFVVAFLRPWLLYRGCGMAAIGQGL